MTVQDVPGCDNCNRPQGPFTPSQFVEHFGYAPSTKEQIEPAPEVIAAAADVDRLAKMLDDINRVWFKARRQLTSTDPRGSAHRDAAEVERSAFIERDRIDDELRIARAKYHRLHTEHLRTQRQQQALEQQLADTSTDAGGDSGRRMTFKQLVGWDKETK